MSYEGMDSSEHEENPLPGFACIDHNSLIRMGNMRNVLV